MLIWMDRKIIKLSEQDVVQTLATDLLGEIYVMFPCSEYQRVVPDSLLLCLVNNPLNIFRSEKNFAVQFSSIKGTKCKLCQ